MIDVHEVINDGINEEICFKETLNTGKVKSLLFIPSFQFKNQKGLRIEVNN